jgi:hypothetical protein
MNPVSITAVAKAFNVASYAAGLPSLAMLLFYAVHTLQQRFATKPPPTDFGANPDALLLMLKAMTRVAEAVGGLFAALGQFILDMLAIVSGLGLVAAILCWFIGHGLQAQAAWARWSALVLLSLVLLVALAGVLSLRDFGRVTMLAIAALCALGLQALWTGHGALHP